jgi:hypothetical protein
MNRDLRVNNSQVDKPLFRSRDADDQVKVFESQDQSGELYLS